jgi:hypothetical protein
MNGRRMKATVSRHRFLLIGVVVAGACSAATAAIVRPDGPASVDPTSSAPSGRPVPAVIVAMDPRSAKQVTTAGTPFPAALRVSVRLPGGAPAPAGTAVRFTAPARGASVTFSSRRFAVVGVDHAGIAISPVPVANGADGSYAVTASAPGGTAVRFRLTNNAPTIVAAGDIACAPGQPARRQACAQQETADLGVDLKPTAVLPLGDLQYETGTAREFAAYAASWGRMKAIEYPVPGNHEYGYGETQISPTGGRGYFAYFGDRAHPLDPGCSRLCRSWYSYDLGDWHLIALDSQCQVNSGCIPGTEQYEWLLADLNAHPAQCTLAYWHIPLQSSSDDHEPAMRSIDELLYRKGVDVVLNGHAHFYERFAPMNSAGSADPTFGIRQFIVGTGGRSFFPITRPPAAHSDVRRADAFGVLAMTLRSAGYSWRFVSTPSRTVLDRGSAACHAAP